MNQIHMTIKTGEVECGSVEMRDIFSETVGHYVNIVNSCICKYITFKSSDPQIFNFFLKLYLFAFIIYYIRKFQYIELLW